MSHFGTYWSFKGIASTTLSVLRWKMPSIKMPFLPLHIRLNLSLSASSSTYGSGWKRVWVVTVCHVYTVVHSLGKQLCVSVNVLLSLSLSHLYMLARDMIRTLNGQISGLTVASHYCPRLRDLIRSNSIALQLAKYFDRGWFLGHFQTCESRSSVLCSVSSCSAQFTISVRCFGQNRQKSHFSLGVVLSTPR